MRVAINALSAFPGAAGIGRYAANVTRSVALSAKSHEVIIITGPRSPLLADEQMRGKATFVQVVPRGIDWEQLELPSILEEMKVDVYHCPLFTAPVVRVCKALITLHDIIPEKLPEKTPKDFLTMWRALLKPSLRAADGIVTVSRYSKKDIVEHFELNPDQVHVAVQAISEHFSLANARALAETVREKHGLGERYALYVGSVEPRKNTLGLVEAFSKIAKDFPKLSLVIAGRRLFDDYDPARKAEELGAGSQVRCLGYVEDGDLPGLYGGAEVLVYPSSYEGFGLPVAEAMACGCPVITGKGSSLPEAGGVAARYVDVSHIDKIALAMRELLEDRAMRNDMVSKGLARARRFSPRAFGNRLVRIYEQVLAA